MAMKPTVVFKLTDVPLIESPDGTMRDSVMVTVDEDGFWFLHGRADDTIKVGGKRVGPAEIEAVLISHPSVSEAAVIGVPDPIKGECIVCFVVLQPSFEPTEDLKEKLRDKVAESMGRPFKPEEIEFINGLPKTRSGKILRGLIKKKFMGQEIEDISSVENPDIINKIVRRANAGTAECEYRGGN